MKNFILILLFILNPIFNLYAGSFIVNITVLNSSVSDVESALKKLKKDAYVIWNQSNDKIINICERESDDQDSEYGISLSKKLSVLTKSHVLYSLIHDSDILYLNLIDNDKTVFEYNSWPGYFDGDGQKPEINFIESIPKYFSVNLKDFDTVLRLKNDKDYSFADDLFQDILNLLKLPSFISSTSFGYILSDEKSYINSGLQIKRIQ